MMLLYAALIVAALWALQSWSTRTSSIPYSKFKALLAADKVTDVRISSGTVDGHYKEGSQKIHFTANRPDTEDRELLPALEAKHVRYDAKPDNQVVTMILSWVIPLGFLAVVWIFLMRRMGGPAQALQFGRSRAKLYDRKEMKTTFGDVAGVDEAVQELYEVVDFLKTPKKYQRLGGRIPKGVLLVGPPGTGKTLLARAVAGEADVPFFYISGSEFVEMFVGVGAARVRELFEQAKQRSPCIIFIDELDTIGKSRAAAVTFGGHDEREQTLNQLLAEMDGFDARAGVIIMAATNRPEVLDQALLRPGRFDRMVVVDRPDLNGRLAILQVHARKIKLATVDLRTIAAQTPGFSGADLENVINEAALLAARKGEEGVGTDDLQEAIERVMAGLERKSRVLSPKEKEIVAYHETGHALVAMHLENHDPVHKVSIVARGAAALGYTIALPLEDRYLLSEPELHDRLAFAFGGRAAEEIVFGQVSTGAGDDLRKATEIARRMVEEFGMSPRIGPMSVAGDGARFLETKMPWDHERVTSDETARIADEEISRIVSAAYERAKTILRQHERALRGVAAELMRIEVLDGKKLQQLVDRIEAEALPRAVPE
jgi:cell division protease FtsH